MAICSSIVAKKWKLQRDDLFAEDMRYSAGIELLTSWKRTTQCRNESLWWKMIRH
ncbi:MAG: hypothetical protein ACI808_002018 [Paraglaciecola sp.]|jgi:hypothetical protein